MLMFPARRTQWWSLAAMAAAATALAVILIESPVRSAPVIPGATVALASDGKAALGHDAFSDPRANRASRPTVSDISGRPALIL
jgi:hypothetical protein